MDGLVLDSVSHRFGRVDVLDAVSLSVPRGRIACLLGPSGCGKTTTLRIAAGLEPVQSGCVRIDGVVVGEPGRDLPPERRNIGMVFQDYALFPHLSVRENICFGLAGTPEPARREIADDLLARLSMSALAEAYPHRLSGGEQQRVALARALATRPRVMLLDEPFANLDVRLRDTVRDDTLAMLRQSNAATLMVTHDPDEAMRMADEIILMRQGRVVQVGSPTAFHDRPQSLFAATFFRECNILAGTVETANTISTPLGKLAKPTAGKPPGTQVTVVVRPEAVTIADERTGIDGIITAARWVGAVGVVDIEIAGHDRPIRVYVVRDRLPDAGTPVGLTVDADRTFVFPATSP